MHELPDRHALLRAAAASLPGETPRLDAEYLLAAAMGVGRLDMLAGFGAFSSEAADRFESWLERRREFEPVAHILGEREFWSLDLKVTPDVLVPRPDSETLIVDALAAGVKPQRILDLGTGSGALLLAALAEWPDATGLGIDRSVAALAVARENAARVGMSGRAEFREGDWADGIGERFDLILCNPPYIVDGTELMPDVARYEPHGALFGGADGLDPYRKLFPDLQNLLSTGGIAIFEFGVGQATALSEMAKTSGLESRLALDLAGRERAIRLWVAGD